VTQEGDDAAPVRAPGRWNRVPPIVKILTLVAWGGMALMLGWWLAPSP
jgi:hypothetical protein